MCSGPCPITRLHTDSGAAEGEDKSKETYMLKIFCSRSKSRRESYGVEFLSSQASA